MRYERRDAGCWYDSATGGFLSALPLGVSPSEVDEAPLLARQKLAAVAHLNGAAASRVCGGITVTAAGAAYRYETDPHDQINILGLLSDGVQQYDYPCKDTNGVKADRRHTVQQLKSVKDAFIGFKGEVLRRCRAAKSAVESAADAAGVQAAESAGLASINEVSSGE